DLAVTVRARPSDIWPWLAQMGYQRGGFYGYDRLDRLFGFPSRPSADVVLPQFQDLKEGDIIPTGSCRVFPVKLVVKERDLVLAGEDKDTDWSWEFALDPWEEGTTRLISRNRVNYPRTVAGTMNMAMMEPVAFLMTRHMLLNIKQRAERLAREREQAEELDRVYATWDAMPTTVRPADGPS
ncbi:MAG: hypothetical protein ACKVT1_04995, partial [Dehalococcoidia bacterium]